MSLDEVRLAWHIAQKARRNYDDDVMLHALQDRCPHLQRTAIHNRCVDCAAAINPKNGKVIEEG